jgi:16S rRNA processing protein RimM
VSADTASGAVSQERNGGRIVVLGRIGGAFGVSGWVKVQSYTDPPENLLNYPVWLLRTARAKEGEWTAIRRMQGRAASGGMLHAQLEGIATREQAAEVSGAEVGVKRAELPALSPGEFYLDDLVGLEARTVTGEVLGRIEEIRAMPAHPLLRIVERHASSDKAVERFVPLVRERIKAIELADGRVTLDWQRDW